jgi:hypothetical protein
MSDDGDRVKVIGPGRTEPPESTPSRDGVGWAMAAVATVIAAVLILTTQGDSDTGAADDVGIDEAALARVESGGATPVMPDVTGLSIDEVVEVLVGAGLSVAPADLATYWEANSRYPEGVVMSQVPSAGDSVVAPMEVLVSAGGPVVDVGEVPGHVRSWAVGLPGFDRTEPLLVIETSGGDAYKSDLWLFGDCEAVENVERSFADPAFGTFCLNRPTATISGVLLDGTEYIVSGLPDGDHTVESFGGGIVFSGPDGPRALGITTHTMESGRLSPFVGMTDATIEIAGANWAMQVRVAEPIRTSLGDEGLDRVVEAIHAGIVGGFPVVRLDEPLRWQRSGELPSRIEVDYGEFRVVAGCVPNVTNVVCDATGAISVEGVSRGFDVSALTVELGSDRPGFDVATGLTWVVPDGWIVADEPLTEVGGIRELLSTGTFALEAGGTCAQVPEAALRDLGPDDVFVALHASRGLGEPWPRPFTTDDLVHSTATGMLHAQRCAERPDLDIGVGFFELDGVGVHVLVAFGPEAPPERVTAVWALLDSVERAG